MSGARPIRVLAIASGGGHWVQLFRLRPAWDGMALTYATTNGSLRRTVMEDACDRVQPAPGFFVIPEANSWNKLKLLRTLLAVTILVVRIRPDILVTTGAAPGYFALRIARLLGVRTVWIDSIANARTLSRSGHMARGKADYCLSQWADVAEADGAIYKGSVL